MERIFFRKQAEEVARRWQIPTATVETFVRELGMPLEDDEGRGTWFVAHLDLILQEQQKAFDTVLFPAKFCRSPIEPASQPQNHTRQVKKPGLRQENQKPQKNTSTIAAVAGRWQLPVETIQYFIDELGMPLEDDEARGSWFAANVDLIFAERQKHFDDLLFPRPLRP